MEGVGKNTPAQRAAQTSVEQKSGNSWANNCQLNCNKQFLRRGGKQSGQSHKRHIKRMRRVHLHIHIVHKQLKKPMQLTKFVGEYPHCNHIGEYLYRSVPTLERTHIRVYPNQRVPTLKQSHRLAIPYEV